MQGLPVLHFAANSEVVAALLAGGADLTAGVKGVTPVSTAAFRGRLSVVQALEAAGVDLTARSHNRNSLIQWACIGGAMGTDDATADQMRAAGRHAVVEYLGTRGADVNARNGDGETALHTAAKFEPDMVRRLLNMGADPTVQSGDGKLPIDWARECNQPEAVDLLTKALKPKAEGNK